MWASPTADVFVRRRHGMRLPRPGNSLKMFVVSRETGGPHSYEHLAFKPEPFVGKIPAPNEHPEEHKLRAIGDHYCQEVHCSMS